jgi:O-antigen/teichoic acid export membrane protein
VRYGALAALLAIVLVLSVPLSVLQTVIAKRIAALRREGRSGEARSLAGSTARALSPGAVVAAIVLLVATPVTATLLHVGGAPAAMLAPYLLLSLLAAVPLGVLQGELRFSALATAVVVGVVVRLGAGIGLVWAGLGVTGAMLATVLAAGASLAVAAWLIGVRSDEWRSSRASFGLLRGEVWVALLSLGSFWLLVEADLTLARHYLEPHAAGLYSSAGLIARGILFLPAAVGIVAFPRFAEWGGRGPEARRWLHGALGIVAGIVALALPVLVVLRGPIMGFTFGEDFREASDLLPLLAAAMGFMTLTSILVYFHVAAGSRAYRLVVAGVLVEAILVAMFHSSPEQIAFTVLGVAALVSTLLYHAASAISRWSPPLDASAEPDIASSLRDEPSVELSLVMPCHNAGPGLAHVLSAVERELAAVPSWEIIVVSDGSTDETVRVAEAAGDGVRVLHYARRIGKGNALRVGLWEARGRYIGFIDADGDITPDAIRPFLEIMRLYEPDIVLGSKRHPLSEVQYPLSRRVMSWTYHRLVRTLFRVNVRDTQTGLKLIKRQTMAAVLPLMLEKRYAFDLELLVVARSLGFRRVFEAPVRIDYKFASQVDLKAVFGILLDTCAIFYRRYVLASYANVLTQRPFAEAQMIAPQLTTITLTGEAR